MTESYDVIIIGSGAGGGTLAHRLAPSGKRILLLERGGWLPREPENWLAQDVFVENRYVSPETWYDAKGKPFQPQIHYFVGGATKLYGAALYRLRREDFGELRHHDGISPAWPISYDELEPYYTQAEQLYQVHGARGEDPTEPPSSAPYPHPAVSHEPRIQQLSDDLSCSRLPAVPRAVRDPARRVEPALRDAACAAPTATVSPASSTRSRTPRSSPSARRSSTQHHPDDERARGEAGDERRRHRRDRRRRRARRSGRRRSTADLVVVSCGAANSARLLLESATDKHPNGLANGSDQVGRNFMFHDSPAVLALSREENPTIYQKTLGLNDFYFGADDFDYPLGNVQMVGKSQAPMFRGEKPVETRLAPQWSLERIARHAIDFWLSTEDLPSARQPRHGGRRRQGDAELLGDERRGQEAALREGEVDRRGARHEPGPSHPPVRLHEERDPGGRAARTKRAHAGSAPTRPTRCLNTDCRAHEVDNLYVVDTSFFPSIGAVNPALTAMANALRVGRPPARADDVSPQDVG